MNKLWRLVPLVWVLLGCATQPGNTAVQTAGSVSAEPPSLQLPASFTGDLPCADCTALRYQLNLFADQTYFLRQTYLGKPSPNQFDDIGSWTWSSDGEVLLLRGGREAPLLWRQPAADSLELLDLDGNVIASELNYALTRDAAFVRLEPRLRMRGMFTYMADAPLFTECLTGQRWPVAQRGEYLALERAYLASIVTPAQPLLATVEGVVRPEPGMEGDRRVPTLAVQRFEGVWPGESCGTRFAAEALEDTYWRLTRLGDEPVLVADGQREPHLRLQTDGAAAVGFSGCNRFTGAYAVKGNTLQLGALATTRMACLPADFPEQQFLRALEAAAYWRVLGQHLELFDANQQRLARFEARFF
ncbi:MAG: META domain-containing protein [Gammaproteobacteria bacterium]|jgi:copper homeostasis protein (lipoprotein)|nr:META domain-containing protein [Gammaproteobacteria bacterium]